MVDRRRPGVGRLLLPAAAMLAVFAASVSFLTNWGFAVVQECVRVPGAWRVAGINLALVHRAPQCGAGTLGLGGTPAATVTVLGAVALPALLAHLFCVLTAVVTPALVAKAMATVRAIRAWAAGHLVARWPRARGIVAARRATLCPTAQRSPVRSLICERGWDRRGPPMGVVVA